MAFQASIHEKWLKNRPKWQILPGKQQGLRESQHPKWQKHTVRDVYFHRDHGGQ